MIIAPDRPQFSAWCPDVKLVICCLLEEQRRLVECGWALPLPLVLIDVDTCSLWSTVDNTFQVSECLLFGPAVNITIQKVLIQITDKMSH